MIKKVEKAKVDRLFSWILATQNFNYTKKFNSDAVR